MNRFFVNDLSDVQSRADIISVLACSAVLLNALSAQEIDVKERNKVPLFGYSIKGVELSLNISPSHSSAVMWACESILNTTSTTSVHVIWNQNFIGCAGVIGNDVECSKGRITLDSMPILAKAIVQGEELYLPDLQVIRLAKTAVCYKIVFLYFTLALDSSWKS